MVAVVIVAVNPARWASVLAGAWRAGDNRTSFEASSLAVFPLVCMSLWSVVARHAETTLLKARWKFRTSVRKMHDATAMEK